MGAVAPVATRCSRAQRRDAGVGPEGWLSASHALMRGTMRSPLWKISTVRAVSRTSI